MSAQLAAARIGVWVIFSYVASVNTELFIFLKNVQGCELVGRSKSSWMAIGLCICDLVTVVRASLRKQAQNSLQGNSLSASLTKLGFPWGVNVKLSSV